MPKINVYLPDELAEAVKESGVPVSAICQRALEQSVKRVSAIRAVVLGDLGTQDPTAGLAQFTDRARAAIKLGVERARAVGASAVASEHLLHGLMTEGGNLALHVLRAMEVEPERITAELAEQTPEDRAPAASAADRFDATAANALELALTEAITMGHNYLGCEHLLLGLVAEPEGGGGHALRAKGVDLRSARGAVAAALAGYVQAKAAGQGSAPNADAAAMLRQALQPLVDRLDRLESHVGLAADR